MKVKKNKINEYIKKRKNYFEYSLFNRILFIINSSINNNISISNVISYIESNIPLFLIRDLDEILIGDFPELKIKKMDAAYLEGAIYLDAKSQTSDRDIIENIIHEMAHLVEETYSEIIYQDKNLSEEFLRKRIYLYKLLNTQPFPEDIIIPEMKWFLNLKYSKEFDSFLLNAIRYERLKSLCSDIFLTPYSITSLREYFAIGFEQYFLNPNKNDFKRICPKLFNVLNELEGLENDSI